MALHILFYCPKCTTSNKTLGCLPSLNKKESIAETKLKDVFPERIILIRNDKLSLLSQ